MDRPPDEGLHELLAESLAHMRKQSPRASDEDVRAEREFILRQLLTPPVQEYNYEGSREQAALAALVNALLDKRKLYRSKKRFKEADQIRDMLTEAGVQIMDNGLGTSWEVK